MKPAWKYRASDKNSLQLVYFWTYHARRDLWISHFYKTPVQRIYIPRVSPKVLLSEIQNRAQSVFAVDKSKARGAPFRGHNQ